MKKSLTGSFRTVLTITAGFLVIFLITKAAWTLAVAAGAAVLGALFPALADLISRGWDLLARALGLVVPNILLGLIFYLVLFPLALLSRLFGQKDSLRLKRSSGSMFKTREKPFTKASFEQPW